ncbi:type II toxin-antitoxin system HipA family toxin [Ferrimonas balearica]|uniref:type II toxin-antitoxin system HipA family toxin n=1 Tax=Ferrimonas balearica TaxID=44012 RepID=UPI001C980738|nr:type II toxin-antitoxin system HipA family toxin [Ferrimonas balearica]MBY6225592.1 type II toxin-antitoxin system HipA family toxin [Ferrimonas balearica]
MAALKVYMNGIRVGTFIKATTGAHHFQYAESWLATPSSRPISLSMPLRQRPYQGDEVYNFFDNLLPDAPEVRQRIVARHHANSTQPFDLLSKIGQESVGALQLVPDSMEPEEVKTIDCTPLDEVELERVLAGYQSNMPLGMLEEFNDFRISIAGVQEKTALLKRDGQWCLPHGATPTSHIIKLPIGEIASHSHTLDLTDSVENEYLCLLIAREYGLPAPDCEIIQAGEIKALAVERFDRRYSSDGSWLMRLPQEDLCQALNVPSARKYENQGGPGIAAIMKTLLGSATPEQDRHTFMRAQVLFWLLAATDGHAKNFSLFIQPEGRYQLTPLYDILSVYPVMGGKGLDKRDAKLAMGLSASKGKKYVIEQIFPRHFLATAKAVGFSQKAMTKILQEFSVSTPGVIERVRNQLPNSFPAGVRESILKGLQNRVGRLPAS